MWKRIVDGSMPPRKIRPRPNSRDIQNVSRWIRQGARWPTGHRLSRFDVTTSSRAGRDWWSLQPIHVPPIPGTTDTTWSSNPVDQWILARLESNGLRPNRPTDRRRFLRRASFDLLGLPATPEQLTEFLSDRSADANRRLIDRLLASPHYGQRWGRHWLDVIGFTESDGYEHDKFRPHAWRYRDYVIDSLNDDISYARFIREQLAGDAQPQPSRHSIAATGFLVSGAWDEIQNVGASKSEMQRAHEEQVAELIGTVTGTLLGLTVNCCRCHDHKFDPLSQTDYYRIKAVFDGVDHSQGKTVGNRSILPAAEARRIAALQAPLRKQQSQIEADLAKCRKHLSGHATPDSVTDCQVKGRHGAALNSLRTQASTPSKAVYHAPPLTVECWAKAHGKDRFNVFVANNLKSSGEHWELYSFTSVGDYSVYMPGYEPSTIRSGVVVTDGRWHYLAMQFDGSVVNLFVDGRQVKQQPVRRIRPPGTLGTLDFGGYRPQSITCDGAIDDVRISHTIRPITEPAPKPFRSDKHTVGLWSFDRLKSGTFPDLSQPADPAKRRAIQLRRDSLLEQLATVQKRISSLTPPIGYIGFRRQPPVTHLLFRGDIAAEGPRTPPGSLSAIAGLSADLGLGFDAPEAARRRQFAAWVTHRDNPLPARVMVNRIWQSHFGQGLIKTPSDLGFNGGQPSHPGLLDWLSAELIRSGWSLKHIHRLIMLSATYHQQSTYNEQAARIDSGNRLLWRFSPRRLDAEVVRDAMLTVSGELNRTMSGPSFRPFTVTVFNTHFYHLFDSSKAAFNRRTIYRANVITGRDPLLDAFDCPSPSVATPRRRSTVTPAQALALMNNSFVLRQSRTFATRIRQDVGDDPDAQARRAFQLALTRDPTVEEQRQITTLIRQHGLSNACWVLVNSSEFLFSP
jgi:hypothetical protein